MSRRDYEEDDYEDQYDKEDFSKIRQKRSASEKKASRDKKHGASRRGSLAGIFDMEQEQADEERESEGYSHRDYTLSPASHSSSFVRPTTSTFVRTYGPHTMEFHTVKIDFDGVVSIATLSEIYLGSPSYGLKFSFCGHNNASKTIWYRSQADRDADCVKAASYFKSLKGIK